ncbi:hypothetical protein KKA72_01425 [Patescibacteria group bacterium]|nr:hypothetical protein [Patescibacteria group bacterium]
MKCEICGETRDIVILLPIKTGGGRFDALACLKCAESSSTYCKIHKRPHLGFSDGTTACMNCIQEMVIENEQRYSDILTQLQEHLPNKEFNRLIEWAITVSQITEYCQLICVLRAIVTKAQRNNQSIKEVFQKIVEDKSVESILPLEIFP